MINAFIDPITRVLKAHGAVETNEAGDLCIPVEDGFTHPLGGVMWDGGQWLTYAKVISPNAVIIAQIDDIEAARPFTHRYFREQLLAAVGAGILPASHPTAIAATAEELQVRALRQQLV